MIKKLSISCLLAATTCLAAPAIFAQEEAPEEMPAPPQPVELKDPVAVVNGKSISSAELKQAVNAQLAQRGASIEQVPPQMLLVGYHRVLDDMIIDAILEEKAKDIEVEEKQVEENFARLVSQFESEDQMKQILADNGESVEDVKESIRQNLKKREWIISRVDEQPEATDAEIDAFYSENAASFMVPEQVRASHILLMTPEDLTEEEVAEKKRALEAIDKKIEEGADFAEMAKEHSEDPGSKENGGDLDYFTKDRMVPEFAEAAFSTEPGQVSDIIKTQFGYHLIKVTDKKEARTVPKEEAREQIQSIIKEQKQQEALDQLLTALKQQSEIKINLPPMPAQETPSQ